MGRQMGKKLKTAILCLCILFLPEIVSHAADAVLMYATVKVNVRSGPGTDTDIIGELEAGEKVFALELLEEGWYRILYEGEHGYVKQEYLAVYESDDQLEIGTDEAPEMDAEQTETAAQEEAPEVGKGNPVQENPIQENPIQENPAQENSARENMDETPQEGKTNNPFTLFIFAGALLIIAGYAAVQIVKEKRGIADDEDFDDEDFAGEGSLEEERLTEEDTISEESGPAEESEILDLDEERKI